jgi:hypothetical protein
LAHNAQFWHPKVNLLHQSSVFGPKKSFLVQNINF